MAAAATVGAVCWFSPSSYLFRQPAWEDAPEDPALERERRRAAQLKIQHQDMLRRKERKLQIVEELIKQRLTLVEAAARFSELDRPLFQPGAYGRYLSRRFLGSSLKEIVCHQVINYVQMHVTDRPEWEAALPRLEMELKAELERQGTSQQRKDLPKKLKPAS
jgi:hypothetical protein